MDIRHAAAPDTVASGDTESLRRSFLVDRLFVEGALRLTYLYTDRLIVGGAVPTDKPLHLRSEGPVRGPEFMSHREAGILNVGEGTAEILTSDDRYELSPRDVLYLGRGDRSVSFASADPKHPARLYFVSAVAHRSCADRLIAAGDATPIQLGVSEAASSRVLRKMLGDREFDTCALVMGVTTLDTGSVWNTMPAHTHERRTEVYLYFDLPIAERVVHLVGTATETRHVVVANEEVVIAPPWSIHSGVGTHSYSFCWAMAGENRDFDDMDTVATSDLR